MQVLLYQLITITCATNVLLIRIVCRLSANWNLQIYMNWMISIGKMLIYRLLNLKILTFIALHR